MKSHWHESIRGRTTCGKGKVEREKSDFSLQKISSFLKLFTGFYDKFCPQFEKELLGHFHSCNGSQGTYIKKTKPSFLLVKLLSISRHFFVIKDAITEDRQFPSDFIESIEFSQLRIQYVLPFNILHYHSSYFVLFKSIYFHYQLIKRQSCHHIETKQLICRANIVVSIWWLLWRLIC